MDAIFVSVRTGYWLKVLEFNSTSDWSQLKSGLETVLDHDSDVYMQLQNVRHDWAYPLHRVGRHDHSQLASLLLCAGLPVDTPDSDGHTLLHGAAEGGHLQLVKLLLEHGADVDVQGSRGDTPLMGATECGYLEVAKVLVQARADTSLRDSNGRTALDLANLLGRTELVHYLKRFSH
ncbi:hypothetical protein PR048_020793 [Dryococelus australis]|uniref:Uncharacterized protein n=1 Tax=Dryococelus australis TaxID=614101 RepID=A0ABQ9GWD9_9NEOP|nr:hypothetical protein PR048_020793 [Dryococelus australis]